jgi:protein phosphatase-4 regulatory subunit 3
VLQDEFYFRYIVKHNLFESIIGAFVANGNRYNLLNSAVLELIDFIRKVCYLLVSILGYFFGKVILCVYCAE